MGAKGYYDRAYEKKNYFGYQEWIYGSYIKGLISQAGLKSGETILDVGCGQGFFSYLFHKGGMRVYALDISKTAIRVAKNAYSSLGMEFAVGDVQAMSFPDRFDCVFTRSCSLYNTDDFPLKHYVTDELLRHVKDGGTFIFAYNTNLSPSKRSESWRYHTLSHVKKHFSRYPNARIFFISKVDTLLVRKYAFSSLVTKVNMFLSRALGLGGDLVCIIRKGEV